MFQINIEPDLDLVNVSSDHASAFNLSKKFISLINEIGIKNLFEIGSHDGSSARMILDQCHSLLVFSAEANPEIHKANLGTNISQRHTYQNVCIGSFNGDALLKIPTKISRIFTGKELIAKDHVEDLSTGKSSLLYRDELAEYLELSVPQVTLDEFLISHIGEEGLQMRNSALWIDVEGAQAEVLSESTLALMGTCLILIEVEGFPFWENGISHFELLRLLADQGFFAIARDYEYGNYQFNIIFAHESLLEEKAS